MSKRGGMEKGGREVKFVLRESIGRPGLDLLYSRLHTDA